MKDFVTFCFSILLIGVSLIGSGCSKDEMKKAYDDAKAKTQQMADTTVAKTQEIADTTVAAVEAKLPATGSVELRSSPTIDKASKATIEVITIGDGRPSSVQICTYDPDVERLTYPAIHLHGPTSVTDVASLSGQTIECDIYMQNSEKDPIAMTRPGESVKVSFNSYDATEGTIKAGISGSKLMLSNGESLSLAGGDIVALVKPSTN